MSYIRFFLLFFLVIVANVHIYAQKPSWVGNTPKELNITYKFVEVVSYGANIEEARLDAKDRLTDDKQLIEGVRVMRSTREHTDINNIRINDNPLISDKRQHIQIDLTVDGEQYELQANRVDEYMDFIDGGIKLHSLFQVATCDNPVFDNVYVTEHYGIEPVFMSLIPGGGQIYKGSYVKGGSLFASEVLSVVGIVLCENQRADYTNKAKEQPRFAKEYSTKARNWETGRNICIGVVGAIYLYNLVDAAVSKGARRIKIKPAGSPNFAFNPCLMQDINSSLGAGVRFTYNF